MTSSVYMDNHATTPTDPRVVDVMLPYFTEKFGNPASRQHKYGWVAESAVENARNSVARILRVDSKEVIFTSGATESNNLAIKGIAEAYSSKGKQIITCATEHKSVLDVCKHLEKFGYKVTYLPVNEFGLIDLNVLEQAIIKETILVSIMIANNEIGTLQDVEKIGMICAKKDVIFHTDATQAVGKIPVDIESAKIDLLSFSGHKIYGPKGVGALVVRNRNKKLKLISQIDGGGHERGLRSGTLNVPAIIGLAKALELCNDSMDEEQKRLSLLRDKMQNAFLTELDEVYLNGHPTQRLPNNLNISFMYVEDNTLMMSIKEIAVSSGSACSTAQPQPSHVLKALGLNEERRHSAIRFGLGRFNTEEEVDYVIDRVIQAVKSLREFSPVYKKRVATKQTVSEL
ncbi:MAG: IscS subfamily cysteine desulfurase [Bacteroidetes bacterium]|nr:IscS subfamily cysteine desulfurase [Bacteroidota bacterium]MBU1423939.1 IscS subfamily cysteine desulfurase [Bacteroidota bacterium]